MRRFAEKRPVIFEILLVIAAFILAASFGIVFKARGTEEELSMGVGRILASILLLIIFRYCFSLKKQFSGFVIMLPALIFALWNVANYFMTKGTFHPFTAELFILGFAPALFEELLFRGIFMHNLKASGKSDMVTLLIPALLFGAIHLTNAVAGNIVQVLVQTCYAVVIGLVFGAIYIRTSDLCSVILAHAAIDIVGRMFMGSDNTPVPVLIAFVAVLVLGVVYAFVLVGRKEKAEIL